MGGSLVVWWIPSGVPISDCLVPGRQFALDSDLIAGAVKDIAPAAPPATDGETPK